MLAAIPWAWWGQPGLASPGWTPGGLSRYGGPQQPMGPGLREAVTGHRRGETCGSGETHEG